MDKRIRAVAVVVALLVPAVGAAVGIGSSFMYAVDPGSSNLQRVRIADGAVLNQYTVTVVSGPVTGTVNGVTALAQDPSTLTAYAMMKVAGSDQNRIFAKIELVNGQATTIRNTGQAFSSLTFGPSGTLYGVTGDGDSTCPECLYSISKSTGIQTLLTPLGNGGDGEVIVFNPDDGFIYHFSGNVLEKIDPFNFAITDIPRSGASYSEVFGAAFDAASGNFLITDTSRKLLAVTPGGVATLLSTTSFDARGLILGSSDSEFQIQALTANNVSVIEHNTVTGDDRGGIAVSLSRVFYSGDNATGRFNIANLSGGASVGALYDGLVTDLATETPYVLGTAAGAVPSGGGTITRLLEINQTTGALTGSQVNLSSSIAVANDTGIFSGFGYVVLHYNSTAYRINVPSGTVTNLGAMPAPPHAGCESWAYWGVSEHIGATLYVATAQSPNINRTRVPDGAVTTLAAFSNLSDMCSFTVAPSRNRWYFHHEGRSQFRNGDETIGFADATFSFPTSVPRPNPDDTTSSFDQYVYPAAPSGGALGWLTLALGGLAGGLRRRLRGR